jgi:hypothetical protein
MTTRIHRPLKIIAFNANDIWRQHYELSKQLQDLLVVVALFSVTHVRMKGSIFDSTTFIEKRHPLQACGFTSSCFNGNDRNLHTNR